MDIIQLVFGFVNAPLFATFLLGMFWSGTTATGAFVGLLGGIGTSALVHGLTMAEGKGGWLGRLLACCMTFPSTMAQNFWLASFRLHRLLRPDPGDFPWSRRARRTTRN